MPRTTDAPTDADHAQIAALAEAASPGPWRHYTDGPRDDVRVCQEGAVEGPPDGRGCICCLALVGNYDYEREVWSPEDIAQWAADADFIAAAREAVPELVDEVRRLRAELAEARPVVAAARALDAAWLDEREHEAEHRALTAAIDAIDWIAFRLGPQDADLAARDGEEEAAAPPR